MRKIYCLFLVLAVAFCANAATPLITFKATPDGEKIVDLIFATSSENVTLDIDWGDGNLVKTPTIAAYDPLYGETSTELKGKPLGEGIVKIYGEDKIDYFDCGFNATEGIKITALDITAAAVLKELYITSNDVTSLDLSKNVNLVKLDCTNNSNLGAIDLSNNVEIKTLNLTNCGLNSIDLTKNINIAGSLKLSDNKLASLNLSNNTKITGLYALNNELEAIDLSKNVALTYVSLNNNKLTSIDVTGLPKLKSLFLISNQLTELKASNMESVAKSSINCTKNNFTLATLPALAVPTYNYAPQNPLTIAEAIGDGETVDLSAQTGIVGLAAAPQNTTYVWKTVEGTDLVEGTDYKVANGVFTFLKKQTSKVYCAMTTDAYPKFTGANTFNTSEVSITVTTGVENVNAQIAKVYGSIGELVVTSVTDATVNVFNLSGSLIATVVMSNETATIPVAAGIYIVTINGNSFKAIVK